MPAKYTVRYKNQCTPQEKVNFSDGYRWYLDSDCPKKLTGSGTIELSSQPSFEDKLVVTSIPSDALTSNDDFFYIKNTGDDEDILVSLDAGIVGGNNYYITISPDEVFMSEISTSAIVKVKTASGSTTAEYFKGT